jgi:hypothetical protein
MIARNLFPLFAITALAILVAFPTFGLAQDATPAAGSECVPIEGDEGCLPLAPESQRVDVTAPTFSNPTSVTNPLFPISDQHSVLMLGQVEGEPFRTEVTLLPGTKIIEWNGQQIEVLLSQYVAYAGGRIHEVALDWYAQADDGAVWYFGEDVFNYDDGAVADMHGTWIAGRDGLPGMIMPGNPQVGDVYRPENIPGNVFEEVTVKTIGVTVDGPLGPVEGAIVVTELHQDGLYEDKTFAPGYGEFITDDGEDVEAVALAVPTDAQSGPPPAELTTLASGAADIFAAAASADWTAISASTETMTAAWTAYSAGTVPPRVKEVMDVALASLTEAVDAQDAAETRQAAIEVAQSAFDLQLLHRPPTEIDLARFDLWTKQVLVDVAADDAGAVAGDVATLEWIRDRIVHAVDPSIADQVDLLLIELRTAVDAGDLSTAATVAAQLGDLIA